jgi:hypothetical protein
MIIWTLCDGQKEKWIVSLAEAEVGNYISIIDQ